ncbi:MAG: ATP synthase F1 subunit delta [Thermodesulfovibrionales bacterium]|nr:ATP synthase F1 subunit delta [Thermodesulfovibrionales bacterium]
MIRPGEAKRYAKAFLDNVGIENAPQALAEINSINELMARSKEFKNLLVNPQFLSEERENSLKQIAESIKLSDKVLRFIKHIIELGLILHLSEIIRIATRLYLERKRRAKVTVMTPIEIGKDYENRLISTLKKLTDRDVEIEYVIDPTLLGGILVKVDSTMYDTSIKGQLRLLRNELIRR